MDIETRLALAEEEHLDALDPLRHFRDDDPQLSEPHGTSSDADVNQPSDFIPPQPVSARGTLTLQFGDINLALAVDAAPGCGGLAWPVGEVRTRCECFCCQRSSSDPNMHTCF